jgi:hypothetical protein
MHVEQVLGDVPQTERCQGHEKPAGESGFLSSLFDRLRGGRENE